jgi:single stranded DNA-binding protein
MASVRVEQRNAHLAGPVQLSWVRGREGQVAKAVLTAISNTRRGSGEDRKDEATAIQWTLWNKQAENAAQYLGKGGHVNVVGRVKNNNYEKDGETVYGMAFIAEEVDYLDSKADAEARRGAGDNGNANDGDTKDGAATKPAAAPSGKSRGRKPARASAEAAADADTAF